MSSADWPGEPALGQLLYAVHPRLTLVRAETLVGRGRPCAVPDPR